MIVEVSEAIIKITYADAQTQTDESPFLTSTPEKSFQNISTGLSVMEDPEDSDYMPDNRSFVNSKQEIDIIEDRKYVVFESMLDDLFKLARCPLCNTSIKNVTKCSMGTSLHCTLKCELDHTVTEWKSQPLLGKLPAFNLLISAAIFFSGKVEIFIGKPIGRIHRAQVINRRKNDEYVYERFVSDLCPVDSTCHRKIHDVNV